MMNLRYFIEALMQGKIQRRSSDLKLKILQFPSFRNILLCLWHLCLTQPCIKAQRFRNVLACKPNAMQCNKPNKIVKSTRKLWINFEKSLWNYIVVVINQVSILQKHLFDLFEFAELHRFDKTLRSRLLVGFWAENLMVPDLK